MMACRLFGASNYLNLLSVRLKGLWLNEILFKIQNFPLNKMHLKISSAKWQPFGHGINALKDKAPGFQSSHNGVLQPSYILLQHPTRIPESHTRQALGLLHQGTCQSRNANNHQSALARDLGKYWTHWENAERRHGNTKVKYRLSH